VPKRFATLFLMELLCSSYSFGIGPAVLSLAAFLKAASDVGATAAFSTTRLTKF